MPWGHLRATESLREFPSAAAIRPLAANLRSSSRCDRDQPLDFAGIRARNGRLGQNAVQEKLTKLWIDCCLTHLGLRKRAE